MKKIEMKKILITIIIFIFTATVTGYSQLFKDNDVTDNTGATTGSSYSGSEYSSNGSEYSSGDSNGGVGFFRTPPEDNKPGGRPDCGGGIGQDAPLGNELKVLLACSAVYVAASFFKRKWKK